MGDRSDRCQWVSTGLHRRAAGGPCTARHRATRPAIAANESRRRARRRPEQRMTKIGQQSARPGGDANDVPHAFAQCLVRHDRTGALRPSACQRQPPGGVLGQGPGAMAIGARAIRHWSRSCREGRGRAAAAAQRPPLRRSPLERNTAVRAAAPDLSAARRGSPGGGRRDRGARSAREGAASLLHRRRARRAEPGEFPADQSRRRSPGRSKPGAKASCGGWSTCPPTCSAAS